MPTYQRKYTKDSRRTFFNCDYCHALTSSKTSQYNRKKRHFCNIKCYADFVKHVLPTNEFNGFKSRLSEPEIKFRRRARNIAKQAVRSGRIIKQACKECGEINVQGHHEDYNKPLDLTWLCEKHHRLLHKQLVQTSH